MFVVKKKEAQTNKTFRLPRALLERADAAARRNDVSLNEFVRQAIEYVLEDMGREING